MVTLEFINVYITPAEPGNQAIKQRLGNHQQVALIPATVRDMFQGIGIVRDRIDRREIQFLQLFLQIFSHVPAGSLFLDIVMISIGVKDQIGVTGDDQIFSLMAE